jgi:hypothetical protein
VGLFRKPDVRRNDDEVIQIQCFYIIAKNSIPRRWSTVFVKALHLRAVKVHCDYPVGAMPVLWRQRRPLRVSIPGLVFFIAFGVAEKRYYGCNGVGACALEGSIQNKSSTNSPFGLFAIAGEDIRPFP